MAAPERAADSRLHGADLSIERPTKLNRCGSARPAGGPRRRVPVLRIGQRRLLLPGMPESRRCSWAREPCELQGAHERAVGRHAAFGSRGVVGQPRVVTVVYLAGRVLVVQTSDDLGLLV